MIVYNLSRTFNPINEQNMKKILLFLLTLFAFTSAEAQRTFESERGDTSYTTYNYSQGGTEVKAYNRLRVLPGFSARSLEWRYVQNSLSLPSGWSFDGFCDNNLCYTPGYVSQGNWVPPTNPSADTFMDFHLVLGNVVTNGTAMIRIEVRDPQVSNSNRTYTFIVSKNPQGITTSVRSEENIKVYPNPARESVNVVFNTDNNVKTISVYNLLGQPISAFHVVGNSANLPLGDTPAGVYFLRMYDAQGRIVATRRFTRQ